MADESRVDIDADESDGPLGKTGRVLADAGLVTGRALAATGRWLGRRVKEAYVSVDPDVRRHFWDMPLAGLSLLDRRGSEARPMQAGESPPVVMVHGLGGGRGNFVALSTYLRLFDGAQHIRLQLPAGESVEARARTVADAVSDVLEVTGAAHLDLVGHSLGGVALRLALVRGWLASDRVRTFVTLGSPFGGTHPARYGNTPVLHDLRPGTKIVEEVTQRYQTGPRTVCFYSRADIMVLPPESAVLPDAEHVDASPLSHVGYLISPKSLAAIRAVLNGRTMESIHEESG